MADFFDIGAPDVSCSGNTYVTCGGTVRAPHGAGVQRIVTVFMDNNLNTVLGKTVSELPLGTFSLPIVALPATGLTVVTTGESGENSVIHSHCREF